MSEQSPAHATASRANFLEVSRPGQVYLSGPFGRIDLFQVTDLTWAPDVKEVCVRPLNATPMKRFPPNGGLLAVTGIIEAQAADDTQSLGQTASASYDHAANALGVEISSLRPPLQWCGFAGHSGNV